MDDLIKLVSEKAGISAAQAKQAVESVMAFLKDKLPGPIGEQVTKLEDGLLGFPIDAEPELAGKAHRTQRTFAPNVHKQRVLIDGRPQRIAICTRCLRTTLKLPKA